MSPPSKRLGWTRAAWNLEPENHAKVVAATAIVRAERILGRMTSELLTEFDLTPSRYEILVALHFSETGSSSLGALSKGLAIHPPTLTYTVDQLADAGFITRQNHDGDRRVVVAQITPAGRAIVEQANDKLASAQFGLAGLSMDEAECVAQALGKLVY